MDWLSWLEKREGGTGGTRKYWLYADGKTSKEARWHDKVHPDDHDEMGRGSAKITHDTGAGGQGYFGVTLRNHLTDSQRSHINQQIKENRYHRYPDNVTFDHGHNNNDTVGSSKKHYPRYTHIAENFHPKKSWEVWLEKDSLDGKQGHDPKKFEWDSRLTEDKEKLTHMKPEDFQDITVGQPGSDAHARHPKNMFPEKKNPKTNKYEKQKPQRERFIDNKDDDDKRYPIDPKRSKDERDELFRERENRRQSSHRGDELGEVEGYKRQLRHGGTPQVPSLGTRTDSQGRKHVTSHEGRHRAQAALEEGEKTIPVSIQHNRGAMYSGHDKRFNQKEIDEMGGEEGEPTSPRHNRDRISSGINSMHYHNQPKDKKIQQGMEALKSWEVWLEKGKRGRPKTQGNSWQGGSGKNFKAGGKGKVTQTNSSEMWRNFINGKELDGDEINPVGQKSEKPKTEEEKRADNAVGIRQFDRKERNADGSIKKSWESWLEKDALDGKGANDKIKPTNWVRDPDGSNKKEVKVSPKKFLNTSYGKESGKDTRLVDTHSNEEMPITFGDSRHKIGHNPIMGKKEDKRTEDERGMDGYNEIARGDELGIVESKKRKMRRGDPIPKSQLIVTNNKVVNHDGRHRARAAMEEGDKEIPIDIKTRRNQSYARNDIEELIPEADEYHSFGSHLGQREDPSEEKDTRHPMFGRKKSWEVWLEKDGKRDKEIEEEFNKFDSEDLEMFGRHMNQESQRTDRIEHDEIMGDVKNPILRETQEGAGGIPHATPSILHPKLTRKKPKYIKGVEQKGDDISQTKGHVNIKIADSMKSWESWLEKGKKTDRAKKIIRDAFTIPDVMPIEIKHVDGTYTRGGEPPVSIDDIETHHAVKEKPTMYPRIRREFEDDAEDKESKKSWESWLEKNNAIETSHKDGEKKVEWDGKFSSSTIEDEVKDEDEKSESEEESLEELTDGKLKEIEKLKSDVDKIITDLARNIKDPKQREDIVQRQADQKVKETVEKAWELFIVNKMPMNQYDKQPQKKPNEKGLKPAPLTETVPIKNPKGSLGKKKVKRLDYETQKIEGGHPRKIVEIPKEDNTNPEVKYRQGGRPESGKQGSKNSGTGRKRFTKIEEGAENRSILYELIEQQRKIDEAKLLASEALPIVPKVEKPKTEEEKRAARAASIRQFDRKKRDPKTGKIIKSWEGWLEKHTVYPNWSNPNGKKPEPPSTPKGNSEYRIDTKTLLDILDEQGSGDKGRFDIYMTGKDDEEKKKSWEGWLEKMQGAGDARFGNQHLTGLDQKPVNNEEDEANILPEKDEKTDDKEEKQEKTDNKPYKALGEE